ncbi:MAG: hypothetical protein CSH37_04725 [Thalassolituus sp.]|jgi:hypothetical protein|nr:MAG: hypothetical protein CSH37_04725 [Thalassolituus sp.]|tara:strand:- start:175 stop:651 length:477 start_codon:yes stop_codon:yes gene_type:complete
MSDEHQTPELNALSEREQMSKELKSLKYFRYKHPRGGQYNDGFSLQANFKHSYDDDLISLLNELGVRPVLESTEPPLPKQYPDPVYDEIEVDGVKKWLQHVGWHKIDGDFFYISYGEKGLIILANGGYDVELSDVLQAKRIESRMNDEFFISRIDLEE